MSLSKFLLWIFIACFVLLIEYIRVTFNTPITTTDLIFTPACIIGYFFIIPVIRSDIKNRPKDFQPPRITFVKYIGLIAACSFFSAISLWGVIEGWKAPLEYFSGVRGSGHGYTLAIISTAILIPSLIGIYVVTKNYIHQLMKRQPT